MQYLIDMDPYSKLYSLGKVDFCNETITIEKSEVTLKDIINRIGELVSTSTSNSYVFDIPNFEYIRNRIIQPEIWSPSIYSVSQAFPKDTFREYRGSRLTLIGWVALNTRYKIIRE